MNKLTDAQSTVLESLYDVSIHEGGTVCLKNRYHSAAHALIRRGYVMKFTRDFERPRYCLTRAGIVFWIEYLRAKHENNHEQSA